MRCMLQGSTLYKHMPTVDEVLHTGMCTADGENVWGQGGWPMRQADSDLKEECVRTRNRSKRLTRTPQDLQPHTTP